MRVHSLDEFEPGAEGTTLALGFFDGFHRGHQAIVAEAIRRGPATVFTFRNHPASMLDSRRCPPLLTTFPERVALLEQFGAEVVYRDFDRAFSQVSPEAFASEVLAQLLGARRVVVGENYRFGHKAAGDAALLAKLGDELGFEVTVVTPVKDGDWISSTRVRALVEAGELAMAGELLGRPYFLTSTVERGDQRGRQLGFPTANLPLPEEKVIPQRGVYAVTVTHRQAQFGGVANLGIRPTFDGTRPLLEVHLLDFDGDLYDQDLTVDFVKRLRPEQKFPGIEALVAQIQTDVNQARAVLR
ncbi:MAG: bifunctional riboflavin kinase/FAD synthetase [Vulcanimicrobiota bacterium]